MLIIKKCICFSSKKRLFLLIILAIIFGNLTFSQIKLRGKITDKKEGFPLKNTSIYIKKLNIGTTSDTDGNYLINIPQGKFEIVYSMIGYAKTIKTVIARGKKIIELNIKLKTEATELNDVIVTAKSEERKLRERAMPISVISMKSLQGTVSDISDVLTKTAGVKIRSTGGVGSSQRISVRGLEGKRIGFFLDGTPLNDNKDFLDINDIPVDLIDRVEVYKGIVPAKFGGSAVGGAVNIVLKEYPPQYIDISYSVKSFNTHKISTIYKKNKVDAGWQFGLGGFYTYSDNNYKMELPLQPGQTVSRDHDSFEKIVIGAGISNKNWYFDEVKFEPAVILTKKEIQGIEYNIREAKSTADAYAIANHNTKSNFLIEGLDCDFDNALAYTIYRLEDKAKYRYSWNGTRLPAISKYGGEIGQHPNDSYNQKFTYIQKINLNYVLNSTNSLNLNSVYNYAKNVPEDSLRDKVIGYKTNFDSYMHRWIVGLAYEYHTLDDVFTNVFTVKYYRYSMKTTLKDLFGSGNGENIDMLKSDYGFNNATRYRFTPSFLIKASVAFDVRLPAENELLGDGFIIAPAGNLEPEKNMSFNIGFMYDTFNNKHIKRFQFEINAFYTKLENMIRFTGGPIQSIYQNFGEMRSFGIETEIKWDATKFLYLWGNATYQDLRDTREFEPNSKVPNATKNNRIPNIPYFYVNGGFELHKENLFGGNGQNTRFFADFSFVEKYFYDFEQSIYQQKKIPRIFSIDVGLEHSLYNQKVFIGMQANNITDEKILSEFNRPLPGRNFGFKIRYVLK